MEEEEKERRERGWMVCHVHGACVSSGSRLRSVWAWN